MSDSTSTITNVGVSTAIGIGAGIGTKKFFDKINKDSFIFLDYDQTCLQSQIESLNGAIEYNQGKGETVSQQRAQFKKDAKALKAKLLPGLDSRTVNEICHHTFNNPEILSPEKREIWKLWEPSDSLSHKL